MTISIEILNSDWGGGLPADIEAVVRSVAVCFEQALAERPIELIRVEPTLNVGDPPLTAFQRLPSGQVQILLNARGRHWAQYSYQFAHELGHLLANFRTPLQHPWKWIEESLCEVASQYAISYLSRSWQFSPPHAHWAGFAPAFTWYLEEHYSKPGHALPAGEAFCDWLRSHLDLLTLDAGRRADNTIIARELLPIFEEDPDTWRAVRYLNLVDNCQASSVAEYFQCWRQVTPVRHRRRVDTVAGRLICR